VGRLTGNKPFDFDADPDHDQDPGILTEFLPLRGIGTVERILRDQRPWRRFAFFECFWYGGGLV